MIVSPSEAKNLAIWACAPSAMSRKATMPVTDHEHMRVHGQRRDLGPGQVVAVIQGPVGEIARTQNGRRIRVGRAQVPFANCFDLPRVG